MKKINRRNFLQVCGAVGAMGVLASCSTDSSTSTASTSTASTSTSSTADVSTGLSDEPVNLIVSTWDYTTTPAQIETIEAFMTKYPNVTVEVIDITSADYTTKLSVMLNGNSELDVYFLKDTDYAPDLSEKGQIEDLVPYVEKDGIDTAAYSGACDSFTLENGVLFAMPYRTDYYVMFYNKDLFDAAGVDYPSNDMTWEEWEALAGDVTSGEGADKVYGAYLHTWNGLVINWAFQSGEHTLMETDCSHLTPYYEMAVRMQDEGVIMDYGTAITGGLHYSSVFYTETAAMVPMATWFIPTLIGAVESGECTCNWGIATIPHPEGVEAGYTVGGPAAISMNAASTKKEWAWEFIKFFSGEEGAVIYASRASIPALSSDAIMEVVASVDGMPEGVEDALVVKNVVLGRPIVEHAAEVNSVQTDVHELIMLGELSVEEGIEEMGIVIAEVLEG